MVFTRDLATINTGGKLREPESRSPESRLSFWDSAHFWDPGLRNASQNARQNPPRTPILTTRVDATETQDSTASMSEGRRRSPFCSNTIGLMS